MAKIRVGIVGVGNCASSLVQGVEYYRHSSTDPGDRASRPHALRSRADISPTISRSRARSTSTNGRSGSRSIARSLRSQTRPSRSGAIFRTSASRSRWDRCWTVCRSTWRTIRRTRPFCPPIARRSMSRDHESDRNRGADQLSAGRQPEGRGVLRAGVSRNRHQPGQLHAGIPRVGSEMGGALREPRNPGCRRRHQVAARRDDRAPLVSRSSSPIAASSSIAPIS